MPQAKPYYTHSCGHRYTQALNGKYVKNKSNTNSNNTLSWSVAAWSVNSLNINALMNDFQMPMDTNTAYLFLIIIS